MSGTDLTFMQRQAYGAGADVLAKIHKITTRNAMLWIPSIGHPEQRDSRLGTINVVTLKVIVPNSNGWRIDVLVSLRSKSKPGWSTDDIMITEGSFVEAVEGRHRSNEKQQFLEEYMEDGTVLRPLSVNPDYCTISGVSL